MKHGNIFGWLRLKILQLSFSVFLAFFQDIFKIEDIRNLTFFTFANLFENPTKYLKQNFQPFYAFFPYLFRLKMKLQNLRFFSVENRHGEDHLLREEGTERSSFTENHIFFVIFPCLFLDPFKCLKCGKFTEIS